MHLCCSHVNAGAVQGGFAPSSTKPRGNYITGASRQPQRKRFACASSQTRRNALGLLFNTAALQRVVLAPQGHRSARSFLARLKAASAPGGLLCLESSGRARRVAGSSSQSQCKACSLRLASPRCKAFARAPLLSRSATDCAGGSSQRRYNWCRWNFNPAAVQGVFACTSTRPRRNASCWRLTPAAARSFLLAPRGKGGARHFCAVLSRPAAAQSVALAPQGHGGARVLLACLKPAKARGGWLCFEPPAAQGVLLVAQANRSSRRFCLRLASPWRKAFARVPLPSRSAMNCAGASSQPQRKR